MSLRKRYVTYNSPFGAAWTVRGEITELQSYMSSSLLKDRTSRTVLICCVTTWAPPGPVECVPAATVCVEPSFTGFALARAACLPLLCTCFPFLAPSSSLHRS